MPQKRGNLAPQNTFLDTIGQRFNGTHSNFLLGSAQHPNSFPIIYCSDGFCDLTGHQRAKLMLKSCSCPFLYGEQTTMENREEIIKALYEKKELHQEMVLYKKQNAPFKCLLDIIPIRNDKKKVVMFLISFKKVNFSGDYPSEVSFHSSYSFSNPERRWLDSDVSHFKELGHRRRSRAVLYNLSENLETKKNRGCFKTFQQRTFPQRNSSLPQYSASRRKSSPFIVLHCGTFKTIWDWIVIFIMLYIAIFTPYNAAIQTTEQYRNHSISSKNISSNSSTIDHHSNKAVMVFDLSIELIYIFDVFLSFRTTFIGESGIIVSEWKKIACHYIKRWFVIDLIAAIPMDLISHIGTGLPINETPLPLLKCLRILRFFSLYHRIDRWTQYHSLVLFLLMSLFCLVAHWLACIWTVIGWQEYKQSNGTDWIYQLGESINKPSTSSGSDGPGNLEIYITSLYFTLSSLTSVGFGNVAATTMKEKTFAIAMMIIGALMHAIVFGNVTAIIQRMYARRSQYDIKMKDLKDFIKVNRLSKETKSRMTNHLRKKWEENRGVNAEEVMKDFPEDIRADVAVQIYKDILSLSAFHNVPKGFHRQLSLHVRRCAICPGDYVIHDGDPLLSIVYVCKGSFEVTKDNLTIGIFGKGDVFGSDVRAPRHLPAISQVDVKAMAYSEVEYVRISAVQETMEMYPQYTNAFIDDLRRDFSYYLWNIDSNEIDLESEYDSDDVTLDNGWKIKKQNDEFHRYDEDGQASVEDFKKINPDEKQFVVEETRVSIQDEVLKNDNQYSLLQRTRHLDVVCDESKRLLTSSSSTILNFFSDCNAEENHHHVDRPSMKQGPIKSDILKDVNTRADLKPKVNIKRHSSTIHLSSPSFGSLLCKFGIFNNE